MNYMQREESYGVQQKIKCLTPDFYNVIFTISDLYNTRCPEIHESKYNSKKSNRKIKENNYYYYLYIFISNGKFLRV